MEQKEQQLLFDKGITNVPSDILCSDNTLEESVGMIFDNGEHRVIQEPVKQMSMGSGIYTDSPVIYIHKFNDKKRYIYYTYSVDLQQNRTYYLHWGTSVNDVLTSGGILINGISDNNFIITSVGRTLVVRSSEGIKHYLWKENTYKSLGALPGPDIEFYLVGTTGLSESYRVVNSRSCNSIIGSNGKRVLGAEEEYNDLVVALYLKNKKAVAHKKSFCEPFFVRAALELYDGSYTHITQPVLLFPSITDNTLLTVSNDTAVMTTRCCALHYVNNSNLDDWADIIKNIVVFVSDGISIYDTSVDQPNSISTDTVIQNAIFSTDEVHENYYYEVAGNGFRDLQKRDLGDIKDDIESTSIFYKLCKIEKTGDGAGHNIAKHFDTTVLENLNTQEVLEYDDYYSYTTLNPSFIYSYNSRLNFANVERNFFDGFHYFMPFDNTPPSTNYRFYVTIETEDGREVTVMHTPSTLLTQKQGIYFFYPDSRAKHVKIFKYDMDNPRWFCILNEDLKEHPGLNGAYYFRGFPFDSYTETEVYEGIGETIPEPAYDNSATEQLPNYIITSEVNNPWVFKAEGYNKVGTGKIIGMSTTTMALSQDAFGRSDLYVFSESGIYGMQVDGTGLYQSIHPFSREVCNNAGSITPIDGAVVFTSEKGLMMATDAGVKCLSEQLNGRESDFTGEISLGNIHDYLASCFIAYDYRDSLLWIFNKNITNNAYCYVYALNSGTFGKFNFGTEIVRYAINDYPDYLLQASTGLFSFTDRQNINLDDNSYTGYMISRPMKFENGLALKSIMDIRNLRQMDGTLQLRIYGSNNLTSWVELGSLRGTPWKYYRFRYDFTNMKATDRFAGSVVVTQERRTDKIR